MERGDLQRAVQVQRRHHRVGLIEQVVEVEEAVEAARGDQQRGFALIRAGVGQGLQLGTQHRQQGLAVVALAHGVVNLPLGVRRLGEGAQVEADHRALEPAAGVGDHSVGRYGSGITGCAHYGIVPWD